MSRAEDVRAETLLGFRALDPDYDMSLDYITDEYIDWLLSQPDDEPGEAPDLGDTTLGLLDAGPNVRCYYYVWKPTRMNGVWHFQWVDVNMCGERKGSKVGAVLLATQVQCFRNFPAIVWYQLCY